MRNGVLPGRVFFAAPSPEEGRPGACVRIPRVDQILLLASNSPRRRQLLGLGNWKFDTAVSNVDESQRAGEGPADYVLRLAKAKAAAVLPKAAPDTIVIGSDTAVVDGADILGKPADAAEAASMLKRLRGHTHQVYTGVAFLRASDRASLAELSITDVPMRAYSDEEIRAYVATGDPLDKAGAYAIQHPGFQPVAAMRGCYAGVMGLPLCHVLRALRRLGLQTGPGTAQACQSLLAYDCPVSQAILDGSL